MAKKTTKKKTTKKAASKSAATASKKKTTKKAASKKPAVKSTAKKVTKKAASKKTTKKKTTKTVTKKAASKKSTTKKTVTKTATNKKAPVKKAAAKKTTKKSATKKTTKKTTKKAAVKKTTKKADTKKTTEAPAAAKPEDKKKPNTRRNTRKKVTAESYRPPSRPLLLGPNAVHNSSPLIKSEKRSDSKEATKKKSRRKKSPLTPTQLDSYRMILLTKRAVLVGDVQHLEDEALRSSAGETRTASNAAEFGTDSFDQSMNLDLAAADRKLIEQIDAALQRIANNTYGLCTVSNEPISKARLDELPWAEHSIETARKLDNPYG